MSISPTEYHSYLLRLWQAKEAHGFSWRASLENVENGEMFGFSNLGKLMDYLQQVCQSAQESQEDQSADQPPGSNLA